MQPVLVDSYVAELVHLDILDVQLEGAYVLNAAFRAEAIALHEADPSRFDSVVGDLILARAAERGLAVLDLDGLMMTALEVGANEPEARA